MVLVPLGSSQTKINVNGVTEYGPAEQSADSTYDVPVSTGDTNGYGYGTHFKWDTRDGNNPTHPILWFPFDESVTYTISIRTGSDLTRNIEIFEDSISTGYAMTYENGYDTSNMVNVGSVPESNNFESFTNTTNRDFVALTEGNLTLDIRIDNYEINNSDTALNVGTVTQSDGV